MRADDTRRDVNYGFNCRFGRHGSNDVDGLGMDRLLPNMAGSAWVALASVSS
jgi:hypothetical protein